ncbi:HEAT repeat domain-containing protein [Dactylosporangium sp. NPDC050688]|uniref:HEAT repeat domain-containing protein n=1 Tax=Dactylosporangium sp. NPDC050688 TaxID=3157217 RepID=UPI0033CC547A
MSGMQPVAQAMQEALHADEDRRWELVWQLQAHGGQETLDLADRYRRDPDPSHRELAADVLSQLGAGPGRPAADGPFHAAALEILLDMIGDEDHPAVLHSIAVGLGHIGDERSIAPLVRLHTHPDVDVRRGVVSGLLRRPQRPALDALIALSSDPDDDVRDWATFGLARQTDEDFPELRAALAARLGDDDPDTLAEAVHGLAVRGDERAMPQLLRHLAAPEPEGDLLVIIEALYALATTTGDPRLLPYLEAERDAWARDAPDEDPPAELTRALARYRTEQR